MYKYINSNIQNMNKLNDDVMIKIFEYKHNLEYKNVMIEIEFKYILKRYNKHNAMNIRKRIRKLYKNYNKITDFKKELIEIKNKIEKNICINCKLTNQRHTFQIGIENIVCLRCYLTGFTIPDDIMF